MPSKPRFGHARDSPSDHSVTTLREFALFRCVEPHPEHPEHPKRPESWEGARCRFGVFGHPERNVTMSHFRVIVAAKCDNVTFSDSHDRRESNVSVSTPFSPLFGRAVPRCKCSEREPNVRSSFALSSVLLGSWFV